MSNKSSSIGFVGLLTILFIGLKLTEYIDWSWLWVLSPIWLTITFWLFIILFMVIIVIIATIIKHIFKR